jgi:hypothetical protein
LLWQSYEILLCLLVLMVAITPTTPLNLWAVE